MRTLQTALAALKARVFRRAKETPLQNAALAGEGTRIVHATPGLKPLNLIGSLSAWLKPRPFKSCRFEACPFGVCPLKACSLKAAFLAMLLIAVELPGLAQTTSHPTTRIAPNTTAALYRISGTITNFATGEPLRYATVAALSEEDSHTVAAVESDSEGHFALANLPAAKYQLTASKRGYRTAFYDEHQEFNSAIVTGPDQDTSSLTFRLVPGSTVRGVVSTEGGDPVENARVMLFLKSHNGKAGGHIAQSETVNTDDTGAYEFSNLSAGEYLLAVKAEPWYAMHRDHRLPSHDAASSAAAVDPPTALDVAYPVTYFDSTTDEAAATTIALSKGNHAEADITLHAVPALHIQVDTPRKPDGSIARAELRQTIFGTVVGAESAGFLDAMQTGTTEFTGVSPGHYELAQGDPPRLVEMDATSNLQVDPALGTPTTSVRGTLSTLAGKPLADECILVLETVDGAQRQSEIQSICMRGAFTVPSVPAGEWLISAASIGKQWSVASITVGTHIQLGNVITVKDQPLSMVVTVTEGSARFQGFARRDGKGIAGVMVVLVPNDLKALQALARRDQSDSDGSFSLRNVIPGKYTLVAIQDGWELDWAQPQVIARYLPGGIPVTVSDNSEKLVTLAAPVPVQTR
jgi:Carboxypeptidase regulatory-like domain